MITVISRLMGGDGDVARQFRQAKEFWDGFFRDHALDTVADLATALGSAQYRYENLCDWDRAFAKETMATTALGSLYNDVDGFGDNQELAERVVRAFAGSGVSIEVKGGYLRDAAEIYGLADALRT